MGSSQSAAAVEDDNVPIISMSNVVTNYGAASAPPPPPHTHPSRTPCDCAICQDSARVADWLSAFTSRHRGSPRGMYSPIF